MNTAMSAFAGRVIPKSGKMDLTAVACMRKKLHLSTMAQEGFDDSGPVSGLIPQGREHRACRVNAMQLWERALSTTAP